MTTRRSALNIRSSTGIFLSLQVEGITTCQSGPLLRSRPSPGCVYLSLHRVSVAPKVAALRPRIHPCTGSSLHQSSYCDLFAALCLEHTLVQGLRCASCRTATLNAHLRRSRLGQSPNTTTLPGMNLPASSPTQSSLSRSGPACSLRRSCPSPART